MKTKSKATVTLLAFAAITAAANAVVMIDPNSGVLNTTRWEGNQTGVPDIEDVLETIVPGITSNLLYKQNAGGAEEGSLAASYTTVFSDSPSDPSAATITFNGGTFVGPTAYMLVKDGKQFPAWYFYNMTALGWNGQEQLALSGFWAEQGAISFVGLYGGSPPPRVPDGGSSLLMLGSGLLGLGSIRKFLSKKA
jgi:hypothetical protein